MIRNSEGEMIANEEAIFPIITFINRIGFQCLGTGFFINKEGGFVTAKHVFMMPNGEFVPRLYGVQTLPDGQRVVRQLQYLDPNPDADILAGVLGRVVHNDGSFSKPSIAQTLPISIDCLDINDEVNTYGYPTQDISEKDGNMVTITFKGKASTGRVLEYCEEGSMITRNPCYRTDMPIEAGQSGGPVMKNGIVYAINSSSEIGNVPSYITPLSFMLDLKVIEGKGVTTFREIFARQQD